MGRGTSPSLLFPIFDTTRVWSYNFLAMERGFNKNPRIRLLIPFFVIILCIVLVFPLAAGCGGSSSNTFIELLNLVPADFAEGESGFPLYFTLIDYASIYQDEEITFSTFDELFSKTDKDKISYGIVGLGSFITGYGRFANTSLIRKDYVGYDITCIDAEIQFGHTPSNSLAAIGRFSPQDTSDALSNQDGWPSWAVAAYTAEDYRGVTIHSWGSGLDIHLETRLIPPHIDELGRARPLAITDKYLFYAAYVETVKLMVDASQNQYSSLADLPEYAAIANGLTDLGAHVAIIGPSSLSSFDAEQSGGVVSGPLLKKYLTCGTGQGKDESGSYVAVVLYHENAADAQANVSLLRERTEYVLSLVWQLPLESTISDMQINAEGKLLLAKLYTFSPSLLWNSWFYYTDSESWLAHE